MKQGEFTGSGLLEAPNNKKAGRSCFPCVVSNFVKGSSCQNTKKNYALLVNMQLLTSNSKRNGRGADLLWRDDYDCGAEGFYRPFNTLRATKPIVIIDEPHRFSRDQKLFQVIMDEIQPQCIIRCGAAFPKITTGRSRNRHDFMYVAKKASGEKEINIFVEIKDVEGDDVLRWNEAAKIECAHVFFEALSGED